MQLRCESCGGTYSSHQADGLLYFHACPPERVVEVEGPRGRRGPRVPERVAIDSPRDENVVPVYEQGPDAFRQLKEAKPRAEGKGCTLLPEPKV
jgi:hypothetical protein